MNNTFVYLIILVGVVWLILDDNSSSGKHYISSMAERIQPSWKLW